MKKGDKTMRKIFSIALIVMFLLASVIAYTETIRQGEDRFSFNPSNIVTKTSAYTVTSSDSLVKVTCTTADIVITLPTVASTRPGHKAYKILKTDATIFSVIVTPATGDTIGGESTRYIRGDEDYIVISTGNDNDWDVSFESPYIAENYESGTITVSAPISAKAGNGGIGCGETTTCSATSSAIRTVWGYVTLANGTAAITGIDPAFTSTSTYVCHVSPRAAANNFISVAHTSATAITINSASATDSSVIDWMCVGK